MIGYADVMTTTMSLRERKKLQTRMDLATTALEMFQARGYDEVTVEEIADEVGISPRTFFRYFPTKEDVLFPNEDMTASLLHEALLARPADEPVLVAARNALLDLAGSFEDRVEQVRIRNEIISGSHSLRARELEQHAKWEEVVAKAIAARMGLEPEDLAPQVIAATSVAGIRAASHVWLDSEENVHLVDIATSVLDGLDRGLRNFTG